MIFTNNRGDEITIEVETGKGFGKHKPKVIKKFKELKVEYGNRLIIFLTDSKMKRKYRSLLGEEFEILVRTDFEDYFK